MTIAGKLRDQSAEAYAIYYVGSVVDGSQRFEEAIELYERSHSLYEEIGNDNGVGTCMHAKGYCLYMLGRKKDAKRLFGKSLAIKRRLNVKTGMAPSLFYLAKIAAEEGQPEVARRHATESLEMYESMAHVDAEPVRQLLKSLGDQRCAVSVDNGGA